MTNQSKGATMKSPNIIITRDCIVCGQASHVVVNTAAFNKWQNGTYIQEAFPNASIEYRELVKTGIHSTCWDKLFPEA